jgi:outer membrane protein assembly factor BamE
VLFAMNVFYAFRLHVFVVGCTAIAACSSFDAASGRVAGLVTPYKVEVVQGNFVSKEQRQALQTGMPRAQVRDILGSPLVTSVFHADRWEYVFTIRRQGQEPQQRKLTVFFQGDALAKVENDPLISEEEFVTSLSGGRRLGNVPVLELSADKLPTPLVATPQNPAGSAGASGSPARIYPPLEPAVR